MLVLSVELSDLSADFTPVLLKDIFLQSASPACAFPATVVAVTVTQLATVVSLGQVVALSW